MRRLITPVLALATASLALTACGEETDPESDIAVAALASVIALELPLEQAQCTAEKIVATIGPDKLTEAGALTEDNIAQLKGQFDKTVATQIADATVACWDWRENTKAWASSYPLAEPADWDKYVACAEKLDPKLHASVVAANLKGASAKPREEFRKAQLDCEKVLGAPAR